MNRTSCTLGLLALLVPALAQAQTPVFSSTTKGTPDIKSIEALGFAPGALLIGDGKGGQVFAIKIENQPAQKWTTTEMTGLKDKLAERIGTSAEGIEIKKMVVDPQTQLAYVAVRKLSGKKDLVLIVDASLKISELPLENIEYARITLAPEDKASVGLITDVAWSGKSILVAAQVSKTFKSRVLVAPAPIAAESRGTVFSTKTYHVSHGKWETDAPIRTMMPYQENGKNYVVAAFTCTPIVKYAIDDLKADARVEGVSVVELGNGNTPLDMFSYEKDGKTYILMSSKRNAKFASKDTGPGSYWTVKVDQGILTEKTKINETALKRGANSAATTQIIADYQGVMMMDRLGTDRALVIREGKDSVSLAVLALP
jgi:hypothetical protein